MHRWIFEFCVLTLPAYYMARVTHWPLISWNIWGSIFAVVTGCTDTSLAKTLGCCGERTVWFIDHSSCDILWGTWLLCWELCITRIGVLDHLCQELLNQLFKESAANKLSHILWRLWHKNGMSIDFCDLNIPDINNCTNETFLNTRVWINGGSDGHSLFMLFEKVTSYTLFSRVSWLI